MVKIIDTLNCVDSCAKHLHNVTLEFNHAVCNSISSDEIAAQRSRMVFALQLLNTQLNKLDNECRQIAAEQYALLDV